jgi:membrane fusion protein
MDSLFRPEAVAHRRRRLAGEVVLVAPLPLRLLGFLLAGVIIGALLFASFASYARKASVNGWLVPDQGFIRVIAPTPGLISNLLVKEGQEVALDERLAEIKVGSEIAGGNAGEVLISKLRAEIDAVRTRGAARVAKLEAEADQLAVRLARLKPELGHVEQQTKLQESRIALAWKAVTDPEGIAAKGFVSQREVEQRRSAALAAEQELASHRRQAAALERELAEGAARAASIPIEIAATRADSRALEAALDQRIAEAEQRRAVMIVAPMTGRIAALPVASGQPISSGATLAVITPVSSKLEAELLTPSRAVGFIAPGQEVQLQLQAFPYQRFGVVRGTIKTVSSTVLGPSEISIPGLKIEEPVFRVRVTLPREAVEAYGKSYALQPGMLLSADIVFDRRSLLQWLFDPLYAVGRRA